MYLVQLLLCGLVQIGSHICTTPQFKYSRSMFFYKSYNLYTHLQTQVLRSGQVKMKKVPRWIFRSAKEQSHAVDSQLSVPRSDNLRPDLAPDPCCLKPSSAISFNHPEPFTNMAEDNKKRKDIIFCSQENRGEK